MLFGKFYLFVFVVESYYYVAQVVSISWAQVVLPLQPPMQLVLRKSHYTWL
jgi:hypothetical protein